MTTLINNKLFWLVVLILVFILLNSVRTRYYINIGIGLAKSATAYEQSPDNPDKRFLILGDSSALGTGADDPKVSLAGWIYQDYPQAKITNKGINGLRINELANTINDQIEKADTIIIQIGGNDIVHFTDLMKVQNDLEKILKIAEKYSDNVIYFHGGNMGTSKLFPLFTRWIFTMRTKQVREIYIKLNNEYKAEYIDMFVEKQDDPFHQNPKKYYAKDLFHPSGQGYKL